MRLTGVAATILATLCSACSFDNTFLYPEAFPAGTTHTHIVNHDRRDTVTITFGDNFQPFFKGNSDANIALRMNVESVLFENPSGNRLNGWLLSPRTDFNGRIMLFLHGNAGNITTHYDQAVPFVDRGFKVFIIDYSGYGFSEGSATRDNVRMDANAALDYLLTRVDTSTSDIILYGQSLGGHLAITTAADNQDVVDGLVVEGAFSSHKNMASEKAGVFGCMFVAEKYSGLTSIRNVRKPVLIIHSVEDETIPFEMGLELFNNANEPKQFYEVRYCHLCAPFFYADSISARITMMTADDRFETP